jgi:hypothetical protein
LGHLVVKVYLLRAVVVCQLGSLLMGKLNAWPSLLFQFLKRVMGRRDQVTPVLSFLGSLHIVNRRPLRLQSHSLRRLLILIILQYYALQLGVRFELLRVG